MKQTFLDYNSTTPVDPRVLEKMLPYFTDVFGNAASRSHAFGWQAEEAVKKSREQVAAFINAEPNEIVFTSGSTESISLAIKGVAEAYASKGNHIVTVATEHKAVLDTCSHLQQQGKEITLLPVLNDGTLDLSVLKSAIREDTILVCIMSSNNETGLIHPISEIAEIVHERKSILFSDATQSCGKIRVDVNEMKADLLCLSAHKFYGPKGTGALYLRRKNPRVTLIGQIDGGGHEKNLRSGTLNVPGIVGLGEASELAGKLLWEDAARISLLRSKLEQELTAVKNVTVNGNIKSRLPNTTSLCFHGRKADEILLKLPGIALATGSACSSALPDPSHVLLSMGMSKEDAFASVRFSLGRFTTEEEVDHAIRNVKNAINGAL